MMMTDTELDTRPHIFIADRIEHARHHAREWEDRSQIRLARRPTIATPKSATRQLRGRGGSDLQVHLCSSSNPVRESYSENRAWLELYRELWILEARGLVLAPLLSTDPRCSP